MVRYRKRALAVFLVALLPGSFLGSFLFVLANTALSLYPVDNGTVPEWRIDGIPGELMAGTLLGAPIALIVGSIVAYIVWKRGWISLRTTAAIAFFAPIVGLTVTMGGFGLFAGFFLAVPALLTAVTLHPIGIYVAKRLFGVPI